MVSQLQMPDTVFGPDYCKQKTLVDMSVNINIQHLNNVITYLLQKLQEQERDIGEVKRELVIQKDLNASAQVVLADHKNMFREIDGVVDNHEKRLGDLDEMKSKLGTFRLNDLSALGDRIDGMDAVVKRLSAETYGNKGMRTDINQLNENNKAIEEKVLQNSSELRKLLRESDERDAKTQRRMDDLLRMLSGESADILPPSGGGGGTTTGRDGRMGGGVAHPPPSSSGGQDRRDGTGRSGNEYDSDGVVSDSEAARQAEHARQHSLPQLLSIARTLPEDLSKIRNELKSQQERVELLGNVVHQVKQEEVGRLDRDLKELLERLEIVGGQVGRAHNQISTLEGWRDRTEKDIRRMEDEKANKEETNRDFIVLRQGLDSQEKAHAGLSDHVDQFYKEFDELKRELHSFKKRQEESEEETRQRLDAIVDKINDILSVLVLFENKMWDEEQKMGKMSEDIRKQQLKSKQIETTVVHEGADGTLTTSHSQFLSTTEPLIRKRSAFRCLSCDRNAPSAEEAYARIHSQGNSFSPSTTTRPQLEKNAQAATMNAQSINKGEFSRDYLVKEIQAEFDEAGSPRKPAPPGVGRPGSVRSPRGSATGGSGSAGGPEQTRVTVTATTMRSSVPGSARAAIPVPTNLSLAKSHTNADSTAPAAPMSLPKL